MSGYVQQIVQGPLLSASAVLSLTILLILLTLIFMCVLTCEPTSAIGYRE